MLAPRLLVATGPSTPIAAAVSLVVVVFPLVPDTSAISRPAARFASRLGSTMSPIRPPMTEPSPRPVARESAAAPRVSDVANLARSGSLFSVISLSPGSGGQPTLPAAKEFPLSGCGANWRAWPPQNPLRPAPASSTLLHHMSSAVPAPHPHVGRRACLGDLSTSPKRPSLSPTRPPPSAPPPPLTCNFTRCTTV